LFNVCNDGIKNGSLVNEVLKKVLREWINLAQEMAQSWAPVYTVVNHCVPQKEGNFFTDKAPISFSKRTLFHKVHYMLVLV
jgi:hypothetical protein